MCCYTHSERDSQDQLRGIAFTIAECEEFRCQCGYGNACRRRATGEDQLCDWCRGRDHELACRGLAGLGLPLPDGLVPQQRSSYIP